MNAITNPRVWIPIATATIAIATMAVIYSVKRTRIASCKEVPVENEEKTSKTKK